LDKRKKLGEYETKSDTNLREFNDRKEVKSEGGRASFCVIRGKGWEKVVKKGIRITSVGRIGVLWKGVF